MTARTIEALLRGELDGEILDAFEGIAHDLNAALSEDDGDDRGIDVSAAADATFSALRLGGSTSSEVEAYERIKTVLRKTYRVGSNDLLEVC